jgi:4-hydroxy-4-methyl-2-oxoglutarate aldolase
VPVDAATVAGLARLGTTTVYEAAGRTGLVDLPFQQVGPGRAIAGSARTVSCGQGDNLMVHATIPHVRDGEVLIVAMPEPQPVGIVGDLLVTQLLARGVAGLVLNGAVRDVGTLRHLDLPIWAPFVRARGATRTTAALCAPVAIGGATVATGDVVVADADGVVAVGAGRAGEVLHAAEDRARREDDKRARFAQGVTSFDLYDLGDTWPQLMDADSEAP